MTDTELQGYRETLLQLRERVRGDIQANIDAVEQEVRPVGEDTREPSEGLDKELALESNEEGIYHAVNAALQRLDEGTFGKCIACGAKIPKARIQAVPYAAYCVDCERKAEAGE